jgi:hypothetical protein
VWKRYNKYTEEFRGSQSGFPLLTPTMQAGQDSDVGWWLRGIVYAACSDYVVVLDRGRDYVPPVVRGRCAGQCDSARFSKQPLRVRTFLKVYMDLGS